MAPSPGATELAFTSLTNGLGPEGTQRIGAILGMADTAPVTSTGQWHRPGTLATMTAPSPALEHRFHSLQLFLQAGKYGVPDRWHQPIGSALTVRWPALTGERVPQSGEHYSAWMNAWTATIHEPTLGLPKTRQAIRGLHAACDGMLVLWYAPSAADVATVTVNTDRRLTTAISHALRARLDYGAEQLADHHGLTVDQWASVESWVADTEARALGLPPYTLADAVEAARR